ncbi:FAD linked oxidase [Plectosphaerella cucumerina]|uniref:D-lactate dehydrogenase (cytochrome) n=1 Tax=Plectosphaerella cucumerina TaxID=40658 RepID=A0A8K0T636_9PEZI|nr:FAD linked oxidase [Plectosphaerella cucumerina]
MDSPRRRQQASRRPVRKRGTACQRCHRRRTKCDSSVVGLPCTSCRMSHMEDQCTMVQSRRTRGVDGRYTTGEERPQNTLTAGSRTSEQAVSSSPASPTNTAPTDLSSRSVGGPAVGMSARRQSTTAQPNIVGESWYASYVMRGYKPGHPSFHSPINDCNETVQSTVAGDDANISGREQGRPEQASRPSDTIGAARGHDLPPLRLLNRLIEAYFARFHVFCPILQRPLFLTALAAGQASLTLVRSVLFVGSVHCDIETIHHLGYASKMEANRALHDRAAAAFDADNDSDRTSMVLASYLLHYWYGSPASYRDFHWWIAASIRSAQCMGYHRSTRSTRMPPEDKARWRRVWWCLYIRDVQISLSTGTPKVINDADHDVEELLPEDLPDETPETVRYIIAQMQLCRLVCYNYFLINLFQRLQRQSPRNHEAQQQEPENMVVAEAAERIFGLVEDSLLYWTPEHFPMIYVSALFSAMMVLAADGPPSPGNGRLPRRIRPGLLALKQFEPVYVLARWIRNLFMKSAGRSGEGVLSIHEPTANVEIDGSLPRETGADEIEPTLDLSGRPAFDFGGGSVVGAADTPGIWPMSLSQGVFGFDHTGDEMGFPQPESVQYQAMHFLADLSVAGSQNEQVWGTRPSSSSTRTPPPKKSSVQSGGFAGVAAAAVGLIGSTFAFQSSVKTGTSVPSSTLPLDQSPPIHHDTSPANINAACVEFSRLLGPDRMSTDRPDLVAHSGTDFQSYAWSEETAILSQIILYPNTTEEVSEIAKYITDRAGVVVDFSRMNSVIELNEKDLDCTVQPGIGWVELNEELAPLGLFFPPDPGPGAMIGGMVGTGCSGTNAAAYGTMKDWVLSLTVVLADGTIVKTRQRARKSSAGFDLTRTFVGSEGTLGMVTEATLKLAVKPPHEVVAVCTFPTLRDAASAVREVIGGGIQVAAVELLDDVQMRNINSSQLTRLRWREEPTLFFKFAGSDEHIVEHIASKVDAISKRNNSTSYMSAAGSEERAELWSARKNALWSMLAAREAPTDRVWTTDVAVPLSRMPDQIEEAKADIGRSGLLGSVVGHVGDGNFHTLLLFPEDKRDVAEGVVHRMIDRALAVKGTATGEHGVGLVKRDYLEKELGREAVDAMRAIKNRFDPQCLLNCGKVVRMERE